MYVYHKKKWYFSNLTSKTHTLRFAIPSSKNSLQKILYCCSIWSFIVFQFKQFCSRHRMGLHLYIYITLYHKRFKELCNTYLANISRLYRLHEETDNKIYEKLSWINVSPHVPIMIEPSPHIPIYNLVTLVINIYYSPHVEITNICLLN